MIDPRALIKELENRRVASALGAVSVTSERPEFTAGVAHGRYLALTETIEWIEETMNADRTVREETRGGNSKRA